jgi:hypothetical protein
MFTSLGLVKNEGDVIWEEKTMAFKWVSLKNLPGETEKQLKGLCCGPNWAIFITLYEYVFLNSTSYMRDVTWTVYHTIHALLHGLFYQ